MKLILFIMVLVLLVSCEEENCIPRTYKATVVVDITDSSITGQFAREKNTIIDKTAPALQRCEEILFTVVPIGAKIETAESRVRFPVNGMIDKATGNFGLDDSNKIKNAHLSAELDRSLNGFQSVGDGSSQVFYTLTRLLKSDPDARIILYSDLLENFGAVNFHRKGVGDFEKTVALLYRQYSISDSSLPVFTGSVSIISPININQEKILAARAFYSWYFRKMGIPADRIEFLGSISQTKLL
jgi:hypothetical protein